MRPTEAAALLTVAAAFDNRKPDADQAKAWAMALDGYRFEDCRAAIVAHYQAGTEWLMPGHVIAAVKRIRSNRIAEAGDLTPPPALSDAEERDWLRDERRRIGDGLEPRREVRELKQRHLPDLRPLVGRDETRTA